MRALVLGGGGITGIAWELGLLAGLRRLGTDLGDADLIVGTSAGAYVGAVLARLGALARSAPVGDDAVHVARFAETLPAHGWPTRPRLVVTAVDTDTGA